MVSFSSPWQQLGKMYQWMRRERRETAESRYRKMKRVLVKFYSLLILLNFYFPPDRDTLRANLKDVALAIMIICHECAKVIFNLLNYHFD